jgi:phytoene/squalene synthetase
MTAEWTAAMRDCGVRTRALFDAGRPVCDGVSGRLRFELRATWLGGARILSRLEQSGFDVFTRRPALGTADAIVIACGTLLWRETPPSRIRS